MRDRLVAVGKVTAAWGLKGWIRVEPLTDVPERFSRLASFCVVPGPLFEGGAGGGGAMMRAAAGDGCRRVRIAEAASTRGPGTSGARGDGRGERAPAGGLWPGRLRLRLEGYTTRDAAESLRGAYLCLRRDELPELGEGSYYVSDLIGMDVLGTDGRPLGRLSEVVRTPANDVWVVEPAAGGDRAPLLLPATREVIREVDLDRGKIVARVLPGMVPGPPA